MVSCKECTRYPCEIYLDAWEADERLKDAKRRSPRLDEAKGESESLRKERRKCRKKMLKCLNKREYQFRELGYRTFRVSRRIG